MSTLLSVQDVYKSYGSYEAVKGVSFDIKEGSLFGLLGPNGAGKTSLIRMITTITTIDKGKILFQSSPLKESSSNYMGYMPEERGLYKKMKVGEQLLYLTQLKGFSKKEAKSMIMEWLEKFQIEDWWDKKVNELSKGMQQKIQFIATVVHRPKLIILDEPFSGLDPINTNLIKDEIADLKKTGSSIIFSTHRMEQVEEICENILLINKGEKILSGPLKDIKNTYKKNRFEISFRGTSPANIGELATIINEQKGYIQLQKRQGESINSILSSFIENGAEIQGLNEILPSLNEIFIEQVGDNSIITENNHAV